MPSDRRRRNSPGPRPAAVIGESDLILAATRRSVSVRGAAQILSCNDKTIRALLAQGSLEGHRLGKRGVRLYLDSLDRYREQNQITTDGNPVVGEPTKPGRTTAAHREALTSLRELGLL